MHRLLSAVLCIALSSPGISLAGESSSNIDEDLRARIDAMKDAPRGPFSRIRWFCADGTVLPPKAYACQPHGGGTQHGEWTDDVKSMRGDGYYIANFLADIEPEEFVQQAGHADQLNQILIEQFLITVDDGWILRKARYYRGALQEESERAGARGLLLELVQSPRWLDQNYAALRTAVRTLKHGAETASVTEVRQLSASLSKQDTGFGPVRNKIHVKPDVSDAKTVRDYAANLETAEQRTEYLRLADLIEEVYRAPSGAKSLRELAHRAAAHVELKSFALTQAAKLEGVADAAERFQVTASILRGLREHLGDSLSNELRLLVLDTSLRIEDEHFTAATGLAALADTATRGDRIKWLRASIDAVYGVGQLRARQRETLHASLDALHSQQVSLAAYKSTLDYVALVPAWASQRLRFHFFASMQKLARIEPLALLYIQDLLRGSPTFFYAQIIDALLRDANQLAGVRRELLGEDVGGGLRGLNPGIARGTLHLGHDEAVAEYRSDGIYLLPETVSDLPAVAGILTAGEGNPLSHVQLLARNLGIPNVGVDERMLERLRALEGKRIVLAVSPAGSVTLSLDGAEWAPVFGEESQAGAGTLIKPDLAKLDLTQKQFLRLSTLRADDSGRTVGPKAAKLGELFHHYPDAVAEGLTIPFGIFRELLDQPYRDTGESVYDWMVRNYRRLGAMTEGSTQRAEQTELFRAQLYEWIVSADAGEAFRTQLRRALRDAFGEDKTYGVFVRSDTNVEDLPGFTGAGLNLTVPNVVGEDAILAAIPRVWASPFTARAFSWRQSHMDQPEHVYPAVLLMRSVPADKSGVLVTQEIDTGEQHWLSVAINEGVGGAVDGQAAESLRINTETGETRLMAQATAPFRRQVSLRGGVDKIAVSGADEVLTPGNIARLVEFANELPQRFPRIVDAAGDRAPADIEFGFLDDKLMLFQIRPFLESATARSSSFLKSLDDGLKGLDDVVVGLDQVPGQ